MTPAPARSLSLNQLIFYGVGTIVGAGIYTIIGSAAGLAGSVLWVSMLFAGAAVFLTALSYAELIAMMPKAGAEYKFFKAAFPRAPLAGFLIALEDALYDSQALRDLVGIDLPRELAPDATTLLKFRRLRLDNDLTRALFFGAKLQNYVFSVWATLDLPSASRRA